MSEDHRIAAEQAILSSNNERRLQVAMENLSNTTRYFRSMRDERDQLSGSVAALKDEHAAAVDEMLAERAGRSDVEAALDRSRKDCWGFVGESRVRRST